MAALTKELLRSLAAFRSSGPPVVSLYLDVDGHRYVRARDYEAQLDALRRQLNGAPADDLDRIETFVKAGIDRSRIRGLAVFSCAAEGLWEAIELPVSVPNRLSLNHAPQVGPLEAVLDANERFGVLLVDRQRARMFVFELGSLVDRSEVFDELPRHEDEGGEWDRDHVRGHQAVAARVHLRRAAQVAFEVHRGQNLDHVILGGPAEVVCELERELHPYLRDRIAARLTIAVGSKDEDIRQAALAVERDINRRRVDQLVARLRERSGTGAAVLGLGPVLDAVTQKRASHLVVSEGYQAPGWACTGCGHLGMRGPACPLCGTGMVKADDIVDEAVARVLQDGGRVTTCAACADLDVMGRIGSFLRY